MELYIKDSQGNLTISDEALSASVLAGRFCLNAGLINSAPAYSGILKQLMKYKFIEYDEERRIRVLQEFTLQQPAYRTWMDVYYGEVNNTYMPGTTVPNSMQFMRDMKENTVADYDK